MTYDAARGRVVLFGGHAGEIGNSILGADTWALPSTSPVPCSGDANGDGVVTFADITSALTNFGATYSPTGPGDANGNGIVNFADVTEVLVAFGQSCP